jgi:hypothetical protein
MEQFIIYRHGWDDSNRAQQQGLPPKMPVLRVEADNPEDALRQAASQISLTAQQHLSAELAAPIDAKEGALSIKPEALKRASG